VPLVQFWSSSFHAILFHSNNVHPFCLHISWLGFLFFVITSLHAEITLQSKKNMEVWPIQSEDASWCTHFLTIIYTVCKSAIFSYNHLHVGLIKWITWAYINWWINSNNVPICRLMIIFLCFLWSFTIWPSCCYYKKQNKIRHTTLVKGEENSDAHFL
jgi:hypothetical protein